MTQESKNVTFRAFPGGFLVFHQEARRNAKCLLGPRLHTEDEFRPFMSCVRSHL